MLENSQSLFACDNVLDRRKLRAEIYLTLSIALQWLDAEATSVTARFGVPNFLTGNFNN